MPQKDTAAGLLCVPPEHLALRYAPPECRCSIFRPSVQNWWTDLEAVVKATGCFSGQGKKCHQISPGTGRAHGASWLPTSTRFQVRSFWADGEQTPDALSESLLASPQLERLLLQHRGLDELAQARTVADRGGVPGRDRREQAADQEPDVIGAEDHQQLLGHSLQQTKRRVTNRKLGTPQKQLKRTAESPRKPEPRHSAPHGRLTSGSPSGTSRRRSRQARVALPLLSGSCSRGDSSKGLSAASSSGLGRSGFSITTQSFARLCRGEA